MRKIKKLNWWQRFQCKLFCPEFEEARPTKDKPGTWVACAIKVGGYNSGERDTAEVEGLFNAYEVARWLALKLDMHLPYANGMLGVNWAVRRKHEDEL